MDNNALLKLTYGLYVVGTKDENWFGGCIVDAIMQTTAVPPALIISLIKRNRTQETISKTKQFSICVLKTVCDPVLIGVFGFQSSRNVNKWESVEHEIINDLPVLKNTSASVFCRVTREEDLGTHILFYCDVVDAINGEGEPMSYTFYRECVKEKTAAAFIERKKKL